MKGMMGLSLWQRNVLQMVITFVGDRQLLAVLGIGDLYKTEQAKTFFYGDA